jgi:hypothetical protein
MLLGAEVSMTALPCCRPVACDKVRAAHSGPRSPRRWFRFAEWTFPSAIPLLLPKCPLCIAAYVAFVTGVGISAGTAALLKEILIIVCVTSLAYLILRSCKIGERQSSQSPHRSIS